MSQPANPTDLSTVAEPEVRPMGSGQRRMLEQALLEALAAFIFPAAFLTATGGELLDFWIWLPLAGFSTAGFLGTVIASLVRLRRLRRTLPPLLTHHGIRQTPQLQDLVTWPAVVGVTSSRHPLTGRRIKVRLHDGRTLSLRRPRGASWLPDPAFHDDLGNARAFAARHGVPTVPNRTSRWPIVLTAAVAVLAATSVVGSLHGRTVVWPWEPVAVDTLDACEALDAAGLTELWPTGHTRDRDITLPGTRSTSSHCTEWAGPSFSAMTTGRYMRIDVEIERHHGSWLQSPVAAAVDAYTGRWYGLHIVAETNPAAVPHTVQLDGADHAFTGPWLGGIQVNARRANVQIEVSVHGSGGDQVNERTALHLAAGLCAAVQLE